MTATRSTLTATRSRRLIALLAVTLAVFGPLAYISAQLWRATSEQVSEVEQARRGVAYLRPLVGLVAGLTSAQSAAVQGDAPGADRMRAAVATVDAVDHSLGSQLGTTRRWQALRVRVLSLATSKSSGHAAYTAYTGTIDLAVELSRQVGENSGLILDREVDAYYLTDAVLLRLPDIIVQSGRYVDLTALGAAGQGGEPVGPTVRVSDLPGAVARERVGAAAEDVDSGLHKSVDVTRRESLGPALVGPIDAFRAAADDLAPSSALLDPGPANATLRSLDAARDRLREASTQLAGVVLDQLDGLLRSRVGSAQQRRAGLLIAVPLGVAAGLLACWLVLAAPRGPGPRDEEDPQLGETSGPGDEFSETRLLIDARDLIRSDEPARGGRAVRPSAKGRDDDAE